MSALKRAVLTLVVTWACFVLPVHAAEWSAKVLLSKKKSESLKGLVFDSAPARVKGSKSGLPPYAIIKGELQKKGWGLAKDRKWLVKNKDSKRSFTFRAPLEGEQTIVVLKAISPKKRMKTLKLMVRFPAWKALQTGVLIDEEPYQQSKKKREAEQSEDSENSESNEQSKIIPESDQKKHTFTVALGVSGISYTETDVDDFSMTGLTGKFFYKYVLKPRKWDLALNGFTTLITLSSSRSDVSANYLGFNGRVGYTLIDLFPVSLSFLVGLYYTSMSVTESAFGFKNMFGPSFTPMLTYTFAGGSALQTYLKLAMIAGLSFENRELAFGAAYILQLNNGHPFSVGIDYSNIGFAIDDTNITSVSTTFSLGYGF